MAVASARVVGLGRALDGEHEEQVSDPEYILAQLFVDQRRVGICGKKAIAVLFTQPHNIFLTDERLAAGEHVEVGAERLALGDDAVHLLVGQVVLVAVGARPAADAVHVAGHGGVKENEPRDVAVINIAVCADVLRTPEECLKAEGENCFFGISGICFIQNIVDEFHPTIIGIAEISADCEVLVLGQGAFIKVPGEIKQFKIRFGPLFCAFIIGKISIYIQLVQKMIHKLFCCLTFCLIFQMGCYFFYFTSHSVTPFLLCYRSQFVNPVIS